MKETSFLNERRRVPRAWKHLVLLAGFFALTTFVAPVAPPPRAAAVAGSLAATAVELDESDPSRRAAGDLVYRRGWVLDSDAPRFGAISAMAIDAGRVLAVNDSGDWLVFTLPGAPGPPGVRIRAVAIPYGSPATKRNRDIEAMVLDESHVWLAYERNNLIARYRRSDGRLESWARPAAMRRWPRNSGAEGMVRLPDGRFLVFGEALGRGGATSAVIMFDGDPAEAATRTIAGRYRPPAGYRVTDAAVLPDGRLLLLSRQVSWRGVPTAKLVVAGVPPSIEGAVIEGREIATLAAPLTVDNMEALSVAREDGRTIVRIASDDNFMGAGLQRTLLLEFELREQAARRP